MNEKPIQITGQCVDIKRLKATGGWRFSVDLFDALEKDVLLAASLVNRQQVVKLILEPIEDERSSNKEPKQKASSKRKASRADRETTEVRKRVPR